MSRLAANLGTETTSKRPPLRSPSAQLRILYYHVYLALVMMAPPLVAAPARYLGVSSADAVVVTWLVVNSLAFLMILGAMRNQFGSFLIVVAFSTYLLVSPLWSEVPAVSLGYGSTLIGVLCVAYLVSTDLSMREVLQMFARVVIALSLIGLILYALRVDQAIYVDAANRANVLGGAPFKGLFPHKIVAGFYAVTGTIALLATRRRSFGRVVGLGILLLVILLTSSSTALVLLPVAVMIYLLTRRALARGTRTRSWLASLLVTATLGGLLMWWSWTDVLDFLGRDVTLTGRTILWNWGIEVWAQRPIFGWGYGAYFATPEAAAFAQTIPEFRSWDVPHFHQTYIQTAADFGLVGLVALVALLGKVLARAYSQSRANGIDVAAGTFAIALVAAAAGFVMYLIPSYAYSGAVTLFLFVALFSSRVIRRQELTIGDLTTSSGPTR
ncbi:O-antigen ligase family protein [Microbacterium proteolyticum]|uniref:O-antigen ligase family protein n=1 Tax=Microbacterium proteolyticum TaxID=1572644 RepID=UPI0035C041A5